MTKADGKNPTTKKNGPARKAARAKAAQEEQIREAIILDLEGIFRAGFGLVQ
jgi:hypothetical protein